VDEADEAVGPVERSSAASAWNPFSSAKSAAVLPLGSRADGDAPSLSSALARSALFFTTAQCSSV
jgi:hypothetical protein